MKIRLLILSLIIGVVSKAQIPTGYVPFNSMANYISIKADSGLHVPRYAGTPTLRSKAWNGAGLVAVDTVNNKFYFYSGGAWREAGSTNYADSLRRSGLAVQMRKNGNWTTQFDLPDSGGVNIYNSDGTFTGNRIINGNNKELSIEDVRSFNLTSQSLFGSPHIVLSTRNGNDTVSSINIYLSEIQINPFKGVFKIDTLKDLPGTKSLRYDPSTGLVSYSDTAAGGGFWGLTGNSGTTASNFIGTTDNASLRFGTDNTERMVLDSLGRLGIGVLSPEAALHVYNKDSGEPTAIFDAHEDRPGTIIEARQAGVIKSAFDTYGAMEVIDNSSQPTTPESGYSKIYSRNDSLRFMNDAGIESTLGAVKYDTCTLATFSAGAGLSTDTAAFQTTTIYGSFYNDGNDTLVITKQMAVLQGSSPSITPTVYWNDSLNVTAGAVKLISSPSALTNTATGTAVTSFDNYKIPPGVWVWVATPTVGTKPTYFSLSLIGYKKRI